MTPAGIIAATPLDGPSSSRVTQNNSTNYRGDGSVTGDAVVRNNSSGARDEISDTGADSVGEVRTSGGMFLTTSDLLHRMNAALMENCPRQSDQGLLESRVLADSDDGGGEDETQPRFELQRRLPDGSTRKADESERKAADVQAKIKQVSFSRLHYIPYACAVWTGRASSWAKL